MTEIRRIEFPQFVVREVGYAAGGRMERHAHDFSNVTAVITGEMEETTDAGEHCGRSCSVLLKPGGTMHRNVWRGRRGTRTVSVEIREDSPLASEVRSRTWQWLEDPDVARTALALDAAVHGASRDAIESGAMALVAAAASAASQRAGDAPWWLGEVTATLERRFDEPLRFEAIASEIGLHPVYLSRAFRRHTGVAMTDYVRALRLRHARHLLSATDWPLATISAEVGFADASHLCRLFGAAHGVLPKAFRRLTQV
jgi:AraC family transcriptional regulator